MIYSLLVVIGIAVFIYWLSRWRKLPTAQRQLFGRKSLLWATAIVILGLVFAGRAPWLMGVLAALLALATRFAALAQFIPLFKKMFGDAQPDGRSPATTDQTMSRQQAADVLSVKLPASDEEIRLAHKKMMQKMHPDRGGSEAIAKQINRAKDVLLK